MKKLNIISPSIKHGGGMERYICTLIDHLSEDYTVDIFCLKYDNKCFKNNNHVNIYQSKVIRHFPRFLKYFAFACKVYFKTRKTHILNITTARIFNPDIVIVGGTHRMHNLAMGKKDGWYDKVEIFLEKKCYQHAKYIIAHSPLMIEEINAYHLGIENKIKMLFPPVASDKFTFATSEDKNLLRKKLKLPEKTYLIFIAGTEDKRKGVPEAIKAVSKLGDPYFLMIFGKTCNIKLPHNAKHFGVVNNIDEYYKAADITLVPSIYEPFGLVVIESLQVGTPVILSKYVGAKTLVNENNSIIIEGQPNANNIITALKSATTKTWCCNKNFIQDKKLSWQHHIAALEKIIDRILEN